MSVDDGSVGGLNIGDESDRISAESLFELDRINAESLSELLRSNNGILFIFAFHKALVNLRLRLEYP